MKKWVLAICLLLCCKMGSALPIGNPSETCLYKQGLWRNPLCCDPCNPRMTWFEGWNVRAGYYGDFVFNRRLSVGEDERSEGRNLECVEIATNAAYVVVNFNNLCRNIDLFGTLGVSNFRTRQNSNVFTDGAGTESFLRFSPTFSWSVGARTALWSWRCFTLGIESQFFIAKPDLDHFRHVGGLLTHFNRKTTTYQEWQVGGGLSYLIMTRCPSFSLVPYAGVKYARAKWGLSDALFPDSERLLGRLTSKKNWGWSLGLSFIGCNLYGINVEARFANETALNVTGQVRF